MYSRGLTLKNAASEVKRKSNHGKASESFQRFKGFLLTHGLNLCLLHWQVYLYLLTLHKREECSTEIISIYISWQTRHWMYESLIQRPAEDGNCRSSAVQEALVLGPVGRVLISTWAIISWTASAFSMPHEVRIPVDNMWEFSKMQSEYKGPLNLGLSNCLGHYSASSASKLELELQPTSLFTQFSREAGEWQRMLAAPRHSQAITRPEPEAPPLAYSHGDIRAPENHTHLF
ncbi:hypothetical protein CapIbe_014340 [Capra ibex]